MKSKMSKSAVSLVLFAFLFWSAGCSTSQYALNSNDADSATDKTEQERTDNSKTLVNKVLLAGGVALTVGALVYLVPKITAASNFASETGDFAPLFRLPGGYK